MDFEVVNQAGTRLIVLPGSTLEAGNSHEFKRDIAALLETRETVVLDLSRIGFIDSSGCGALLYCQRTARAHGGAIVLCGLSPQLQGLLKVIQMDRKIPLYASRTEAMAAVNS